MHLRNSQVLGLFPWLQAHEPSLKCFAKNGACYLQPLSIFLRWRSVPKQSITFRLVQPLSSGETELGLAVNACCRDAFCVCAWCVKLLGVWINRDLEHTFDQISGCMLLVERNLAVTEQGWRLWGNFFLIRDNTAVLCLKWFASISWETASFGGTRGDGLP